LAILIKVTTYKLLAYTLYYSFFIMRGMFIIIGGLRKLRSTLRTWF